MDLKIIQNISVEIFDFWDGNVHGWAPQKAIEKLDAARLDWLKDLTITLEIWVDKGLNMSDGELILAYANLGSLVEGWLKLYYCIYYMDYLKKPLMDYNQKLLEPNNLSFENLKQFSRGKIWSTNSCIEKWVEKVQRRRNAIHSFNNRDIGNPNEFLEDITSYYTFIQSINNLLPYPDPWGN